MPKSNVGAMMSAIAKKRGKMKSGFSKKPNFGQRQLATEGQSALNPQQQGATTAKAQRGKKY